MLTYVIAKPKRKAEDESNDFALPPDLRRRLRAWVDIDAVGPPGFWIWFRAILPLLPRPDTRPRRSIFGLAAPREEIRVLEQRMVVYAREQARLAIIGEQYARDNERLARRLKALEAVLRTVELAGQKVVVPADPDADEASARYVATRRSPRARSVSSDVMAK